MEAYVQTNRELWDEWAEVNVRSAFYDVEGERRELKPFDALMRDGLGDLAGKSVLHLQCHFGLDTLRAAKAAREAVGVDLSPKAIGIARGLAAELGLPARFIESDVFGLPALLDEQFDVVFSSYGAIEWLRDLGAWGKLVARYLKPGGRCFLADAHPTALIFESEGAFAAPELRVKYSYFPTGAPIEFGPTVGNYADPTAVITKGGVTWPHSMSEIVMALLDAGLRLESLREHTHAVWQFFPFAVPAPELGETAWTLPPELPQIPLMFSLVATKPLESA